MTTYNPTAIGTKLKEERVKRNLRQKDVAQELGFTTRALSNWESGKKITLRQLVELLSYYNSKGSDAIGLDDVIDIKTTR